MNKVAVNVHEYLQSQGWHFSFDALRNIFSFRISVHNCDSFEVMIIVRDVSICTYAIMPVKVPGSMRAQAAEFITRANYGLSIGNLEMDMTDGEVRCKSSIPCDEDNVPARDVTGTCIDMAFIIMDRYAPGLLRMIYGGMSAEAAVELVESGADDMLN